MQKCSCTEIHHEIYKTFCPSTETTSNVKIMFQKGNCLSQNQNAIQIMSKEFWSYFKKSLPKSIISSNHINNCKRKLPCMDLAMKSILFQSNIKTILAHSSGCVDLCHSTFCSGFVLGNKKQFPNKSDINNPLCNTIHKLHGNIITAVDLSYSNEDMEIDNTGDHDWFPVGVQNFIK